MYAENLSERRKAARTRFAPIRPRSYYFDENARTGAQVFVPPRLASDIADSLRLTRGPGGGLWYDAGGVYKSDAEQLVANIVQQVLGEDFRHNHLTEVISWCKALLQGITADAPPEGVLNLKNGVLELDTLTLRPLKDDERFIYQLPVRWNPDAQCPDIEKFVAEVVPADAVDLMWEIVGLCLLPTQRYRRAVMFIGEGNNGKSVMLSLVRELLGENVSSKTLQELSDDRFAKAELFGKLANVAGDLDPKPIERSGAFKTLTGNDLTTAERKFGQPFQFVSYATLIFSANEWPVSFDQTNAYFKRWIAVPFEQRYQENANEPLKAGERRADPLLTDRLSQPGELEGLLVKAVGGARELRRRGGFDLPRSSLGAVREYREWADTVMAWMDDSVRAQAGAVLTRSMVYQRYVTWCKGNGRSPMSTRKFWPRLRELLKEQGVEFEEAKDARADRALFGVLVAMS